MHKIEPAPTGRAACRGCKSPIAKGSLRFAEEFQNPYSDEGGASYRYWHLACAATKLANEVAAVLSTYEGPPIEDRASIEAAVREHLRPEMPFAEHAPNGRARCRACDAPIAKGALRVAFERVFDGPMGPQKAAAYCHPGCVGGYLQRERQERTGDGAREPMDREEILRLVVAHSSLPQPEVEQLRDEMLR